MTSFDLVPTDSKASFYGKCKVIIDEFGTRKLLSYNTFVASISDGGILKITKNKIHLTTTTLRHISAFLKYYQIKAMSKQQILER